MCLKIHEHCPTCPYPHYLGIYNCKTLTLTKKSTCPTPIPEHFFKLREVCERCRVAKLAADKAELLRIPSLGEETELEVSEGLGLNVYAVPDPREERVRRGHHFAWGW
jgi:hypothetical protein